MIRRFITILTVVTILGGLIAYSKFRGEPSHVSGWVEADEIRVGSRVGGRIQSVLVEEGQRVEQGQVLIKLEPFDLLEREQEALEKLAAAKANYERLYVGFRPEEISQAKARFDQFQARLDLLKAGARPQEIDGAAARLRVAKSELILAKQNYQRAERLFQKQALSREEFDSTSEKLEAAQALVIVREKELDLLESGARKQEIEEAQAKVEEARQGWHLAQKGYRREQIEEAKAAHDAAQAALNIVREHKKELIIQAPADGVIEALDLKKGDLVPAGAPVLSILDDRQMWVQTYVPQNRVGLQVGQKLPITVDCLGDQRFLGEISFISRESEFTPSNVQTPEDRRKQVYRMKVLLRDPERKLRPGMTVDVGLEPVDEEQS